MQPPNKKIIAVAEVLPKDQGIPQPVVLHQEDKLPGRLTLKASRAYFWESQRAVGNRDSTLKGHTQNPTHSGTQGRSSQFERSLGETHLLILESLMERQDVMELTLGTQILTAAILGSSFYHKDTGIRKSHFGILPLAY